MKKYTQLSKLISHALRHEPWLYELELDEEGWVDCQKLIDILRMQSVKYQYLLYQDIEQMIESSDKKRHELCGGKIRALYGHSTPYKLTKEKCIPPINLYHGTKPDILDIIKAEGLKPIERHYVHLSRDIETAVKVGLRKSDHPIILTIKAKNAHENGINFYLGNEIVLLTDYVPPAYISICDSD